MNTTLALATVVALSGTLSAQVVINEVGYDAPGADDGSVFVELFGPAGFDISGWRIQSIEGTTASPSSCNPQAFVFPPGTRIPADGFVVVADGIGSTGTTNVANADFVDNNFDLENGPDAVQLLDANGTAVDAVAYGPVDTSLGAASTCNGQRWFEGNPARDVFAPLSIERCPAGRDTGDNDKDFAPNVPTPGVGEACCEAIEWISQGNGNSISLSLGQSVGFDLFLSCGAGKNYYVLAAVTDPTVTPPPPPFPVFDQTTSVWLTASLAGGPFVGWAGTLDANGRAVGSVRLDFSATPATIGAPFNLFVGAISLEFPPLVIRGTNHVMVTLNP